MLLEPIYEQDFLECSYGFRPGRSAHDALKSFRDQTMNCRPKGGMVLEVDNEPDDRPGTFDLLGFTHYWAVSRKGYWVVKLKTASDRFSRAVRSIDQWCRHNRHLPIGEQQQKLNAKLRGHYTYYGVTGNSGSLSSFHQAVEERWRKCRSSLRLGKPITWRRAAGYVGLDNGRVHSSRGFSMNVQVVQRRLWEQSQQHRKHRTTRWIAASCDRVLERSPNQDRLESRMLGNLHVRFGVGAGGETPPAYTTWVSNHPGPPGPTRVGSIFSAQFPLIL